MKIKITRREVEHLSSLRDKMNNSITPGEASYYKNKIDSLLFRAKIRGKREGV